MAHAPAGPEGDPPQARAAGVAAVAVKAYSAEIQKRRRETVL
jgi:hypothetical protein